MVKDNVLKEKETDGMGLAKDIYVEEALNVLDDLQLKLSLKKRQQQSKEQAGKS
jgi:carboxyl-terminal processing protease